MHVKCVICDTIHDLPNDLPLAKKLRNRPIHTFMCAPCSERISINTHKRIDTGNFNFYRTSSKFDEEF